ncbi:MAG TPA: anti-sigma factor [Trinickia sp.]|jgi:anti-sigma-K factor RskA|nr:anti-sigma factor [Trinickia sp.]
MDLHRYPDLIDRLAAEYALGVLRGGARRRLERLADAAPTVRAAIDAWQTRIGALAELGPAVEPPATAWEALERRLGLAPAAAAHAPGRLDDSARLGAATLTRGKGSRWFESLGFWRSWSIGATGAAVAAAIALAVTLRPFSPGASPTAPPTASLASTDEGAAGTAGPAIERVSYVAALADVRTDKTMVFVMWDDKSAMMSAHRMSGGDAPPPGKSEQLWGIPEHGQPVSLGMLPPGKIVHMKVHGMNAFVKLAVSVEPPGGSTSANGPSGPIVCAGQLKSTA